LRPLSHWLRWLPQARRGVWIGVPGFGIGIGTGPTYGYGDPYYGGYRYGATYASEGYAYEPGYEYDGYAYVPDSGYTAYSYGPGVTYGYGSTESYRYAPRASLPKVAPHAATLTATLGE
jgi:hypothetical protein